MLHIDEYFSLFACGLCVIIGLGLFIRPANKRNILLGLALIFLAYIQLSSVLITAHLMVAVPHMFYTQIPVAYAIAPLLYLYIKSFTQEKEAVCGLEYLHFLPSIVFLFMLIPFFMQSAEQKIAAINSLYKGWSMFIICAMFSMVAFITYTVKLIVRVHCVYHRENPLHARLVKVFLIFFSWIVLVVIKMIGISEGIDFMWRITNVIIGMEVIILYMALQRYPILLSYAKMTVEKNRPSRKNILDSVDTENLKKQIDIMMKEEKLFCDEDLTLGRFAHALEITPHQLSAVLNEHYEKNFNAFVNSHRIHFACSLLNDDEEVSTLSVAFASGFNSYSAFYGAFKKETGMAPGNYKGTLAGK